MWRAECLGSPLHLPVSGKAKKRGKLCSADVHDPFARVTFYICIKQWWKAELVWRRVRMLHHPHPHCLWLWGNGYSCSLLVQPIWSLGIWGGWKEASVCYLFSSCLANTFMTVLTNLLSMALQSHIVKGSQRFCGDESGLLCSFPEPKTCPCDGIQTKGEGNQIHSSCLELIILVALVGVRKLDTKCGICFSSEPPHQEGLKNSQMSVREKPSSSAQYHPPPCGSVLKEFRKGSSKLRKNMLKKKYFLMIFF